MEENQELVKCHVDLARIHKGSPYNCSGYIPEILAKKPEDVINMPEVQEMINKTYGKHFILNVFTENSTSYLEYEIEKPRAIV